MTISIGMKTSGKHIVKEEEPGDPEGEVEEQTWCLSVTGKTAQGRLLQLAECQTIKTILIKHVRFQGTFSQ